MTLAALQIPGYRIQNLSRGGLRPSFSSRVLKISTKNVIVVSRYPAQQSLIDSKLLIKITSHCINFTDLSYSKTS